MMHGDFDLVYASRVVVLLFDSGFLSLSWIIVILATFNTQFEPKTLKLQSQPVGGTVTYLNKPEHHGKMGKKSNNAKSKAVLEKFHPFASQMDGRKAVMVKYAFSI